ncbi:Hypothetical predicted protein [Paramuricea clavata]|uniref:Uncharacterized protein n=1 Tax=Paramuricea clavata TaxID=317549 RepID=A0A7D9D9P4_PARCT|nr:Hypothetical predicted protein [Paramuricea clavata]
MSHNAVWDRRINLGINPYAGRPQRIRRNNQRGAGLPTAPIVANPGDLLQRAVTDAVMGGKRFAARQMKKAKRAKAKTRRLNARAIMQKHKSSTRRVVQEGGRLQESRRTRKPINHMPVVYQYHQ